jgi:hypothetical protein
MANQGRRLVFDEIRSLSDGAIAANYSAIGSALDHIVRLIKIDNLTDANLLFSLDGSTDHFVLHASSSMILDIGSNKMHYDGFYIAKGTILYVKRIDAGAPVGTVYYSAIYGQGE